MLRAPIRTSVAIILGLVLAGCAVPEPTPTLTSTPTPRSTTSPPTATPSASLDAGASEPPFDRGPPDAIHNADLLPFACSYPFDEIVETEWGHELKRTMDSLAGWGEETSCGLRIRGTDYVGIIHVYKPLSMRVVERRFIEIARSDAPIRETIAGTPVLFSDVARTHPEDAIIFVAHPRNAVLIGLRRARWDDVEAAMRDVAAGVIAALDQ